MATKKSGRYRVLRDFGTYLAGDLIDLDDDTAAELVRDGMVERAEEG
jgi:hypothetical protein